VFANFAGFRRLAAPMIASLVLMHAVSAGAANPPSPEEALQAYVIGLRTGNLEALQELFLAEGQFCLVSKEDQRNIVCKRFSEVLAGWVAKPDPLTSGRVIHRKDATPSMSAITYELKFGGAQYLDQLLLYRVESRWQVVAKTTTVR
jgi:hypothetical protein